PHIPEPLIAPFGEPEADVAPVAEELHPRFIGDGRVRRRRDPHNCLALLAGFFDKADGAGRSAVSPQPGLWPGRHGLFGEKLCAGRQPHESREGNIAIDEPHVEPHERLPVLPQPEPIADRDSLIASECDPSGHTSRPDAIDARDQWYT